jgi:hypothetical protein
MRLAPVDCGGNFINTTNITVTCTNADNGKQDDNVINFCGCSSCTRESSTWRERHHTKQPGRTTSVSSKSRFQSLLTYSTEKLAALTRHTIAASVGRACRTYSEDLFLLTGSLLFTYRASMIFPCTGWMHFPSCSCRSLGQ